MKITVYQRTPRGWQLATEYYNWSTQFRPVKDDDPVAGKVECPGCGRTMNRSFIRFDHMCPGTLTNEPVYVTKVRWNTIERKLMEGKMAQYMQNAQHRIVTSG